MRTAWLLQGLGFLILLIAVYFLLRENTEPQTEIPNDMITSANEEPMNEENIIIRSPAFREGSAIPSKYTCDGEDISPPLSIENIPSDTVSLALVVDDSDAPMGTWDHWVLFNISPETTKIGEGGKPQGPDGNTSWNKTGYGGPCPPDGEHRYFFKIYALDTKLGLGDGATKEEVLEAMKGHVLSESELMGVYKRI